MDKTCIFKKQYCYIIARLTMITITMISISITDYQIDDDANNDDANNDNRLPDCRITRLQYYRIDRLRTQSNTETNTDTVSFLPYTRNRINTKLRFRY